MVGYSEKSDVHQITYPNYLDDPLRTFAELRWPDGPVCPKCGTKSKAHYYLKTRRLWKCRKCYKQFSVKQGSILEDSPISLEKWLAAIRLLRDNAQGGSSRQLADALGITQKSAWFMIDRIHSVWPDLVRYRVSEEDVLWVINGSCSVSDEEGEPLTFTLEEIAYIVADIQPVSFDEATRSVREHLKRFLRKGYIARVGRDSKRGRGRPPALYERTTEGMGVTRQYWWRSGSPVEN